MMSAQRVYEHPRTSPNGSASVAVEMPALLHPPESLWQRFKQMVSHAGATLPKWAAPVVLGVVLTTLFSVLLGVGAFIYSDMRTTMREQSKTIQDQRDILIELRTSLKDKDSHDQQHFQQLENRFQSVEAWQQVTNKVLAKLER